MSVTKREILNVMQLMKALLDGKWIKVDGCSLVYRLGPLGGVECIATADLKDAIEIEALSLVYGFWSRTGHDIESFCGFANNGFVSGWDVVHDPSPSLLSTSQSYVRKVEL